jgi:hypothetical protein
VITVWRVFEALPSHPVVVLGLVAVALALVGSLAFLLYKYDS